MAAQRAFRRLGYPEQWSLGESVRGKPPWWSSELLKHTTCAMFCQSGVRLIWIAEPLRETFLEVQWSEVTLACPIEGLAVCSFALRDLCKVLTILSLLNISQWRNSRCPLLSFRGWGCNEFIAILMVKTHLWAGWFLLKTVTENSASTLRNPA